MDRLQRAALLMRLIGRLRERGSWCGETHVQKAVNLLQEVMQTPTGFEFILYKFGPFSFDLRDELTALRADELLRLEPQGQPFGPRIALTDRSEYVQELFTNTIAAYDYQITFIADQLGNKNVAELERLATAIFVTRRADEDSSVDDRSNELRRLKPHISPESAHDAMEEVDRLTSEALKVLSRSGSSHHAMA